MNRPIRHYLTVSDLERDEIVALVNRAITLKKHFHDGFNYRPATGKVLGMMFENFL